MSRPYHVLLVRFDGKWGVNFGSFSRSEVKFEAEEWGEYAGNVKIITCPNSRQKTIDAAVAALNEE